MPAERTDAVVVGCGGGGAVVAKELAELGLQVRVLEAGPWYRGRDEVFSELEWDMLGVNGKFRWGPRNRAEPPWQRRLEGDLAAVLQVAGVGGTTLHYFANCPRAYRDSIDESWPLSYENLIPYYERVEATLPVQEVSSLSPKDALFAAGCERIGLSRLRGADVSSDSWRPQRNAILDASCRRCGQCFTGCVHPEGPDPHKAKRSTDVSYVPLALQTARCEIVPNSFVEQIRTSGGRATGVRYRDPEGALRDVTAGVVVLSAGAIEGPRLWLNSGLPDPFDVVGRFLTVHCLDYVTGFFERETSPHLGQSSEVRADFPGRGFLEVTGHGPGFFAGSVLGGGQVVPEPRAGPDSPWATAGLQWGAAALERMREFPRSLTISIGTDDTSERFNRVTVEPGRSDVDQHGALPRVVYRATAETRRRRDWLARKAAEILAAAGAPRESIHRTQSHLVGVHMQGTLRMGRDPKHSVVDGSCEAHLVKRLFVADNCALPNALGGANPTLTCQALATRTAEKIKTLYF